MTFKRVLNLVLLLFVAISIFTLIYKEKGEKKEQPPSLKNQSSKTAFINSVESQLTKEPLVQSSSMKKTEKETKRKDIRGFNIKLFTTALSLALRYLQRVTCHFSGNSLYLLCQLHL